MKDVAGDHDVLLVHHVLLLLMCHDLTLQHSFQGIRLLGLRCCTSVTRPKVPEPSTANCFSSSNLKLVDACSSCSYSLP